MFENVTLELSLKPFKQTDETYIRKVCAQIFEQWRPLLKKRKSISIMLWVGDGSELLDYAERVTPERDAKLARLRSFIEEKARSPYNPGNRKVLVFTAFADTADYLFDQLAPQLKSDLGLECAEVTGDRNRTWSLKLPRTTFEEVLGHFSPVSKELSDEDRALGEIDVLFATDCISEGQNLQDCDCLVNYDIHWNPVRIIQRFGRIDRLGSTNRQIQLVDF